ncbi:leukemia-associated protein 7 isoform X1 [Clarias gariepinus]|uniref:leukemia-associated protein 7 isoform X1 n=1 Tax=Clarias gariepinus TaxID=13013 RepID=UPI00234C582C|nr:leukemia-associated protein 7 isoform X1 [Clarias gariepinus]
MSSLKHQTEALKLLHELQANRMTGRDTRVTVADRARESLLSRLMDILSQIISIELDLTSSLSGEMKCFLRHKDSVDLKNICLRMAVTESSDSDRNLKELRLCLQLIVDNLLSALRHHNNLSSTGATRQLMGISITLPDI